MRRIWVDGWQMQCCGEAFEVGSSIQWTVAAVDREFLAAVLGGPEAALITDAEEHHAAGDTGRRSLAGEVRSIGAVSCAYGPSPRGDVLFPVSGTAEVLDRQRADGWEPEPDGLTFLGYVVDLDEIT